MTELTEKKFMVLMTNIVKNWFDALWSDLKKLIQFQCYWNFGYLYVEAVWKKMK